MVLAVSTHLPTQAPTGIGLQIINIKNDYLLEDSGVIDLHFHVYNSSNFILDSNKINCTIHIYNNTNNHVLISNMYSDEREDIEATLGTNITGIAGYYPYIVYCNSTQKEAGFISDGFSVQLNPDPDMDGAPLAAYILAIGFLSIILIIAAAIISPEHKMLKLAFILFSFISFIGTALMLLPVLTRYYDNVELSSNVLFIVWVTVIFIVLVIFYFIIYYIWKAAAKSADDDTDSEFEV